MNLIIMGHNLFSFTIIFYGVIYQIIVTIIVVIIVIMWLAIVTSY